MIDFDAAKQEILEWISETIEVPVDQISLDKPWADLGLDSLDAVHMVATIESIIQQELPETVVQEVTNLAGIFELMREKMDAGGG